MVPSNVTLLLHKIMLVAQKMNVIIKSWSFHRATLIQFQHMSVVTLYGTFTESANKLGHRHGYMEGPGRVVIPIIPFMASYTKICQCTHSVMLLISTQ